MRKVAIVAASSLVLWAVACGSDDDGPEKIELEDASLRVMVDLEEKADVASAELSLRSCGETDPVASVRASIEQWAHEAVVPSYAREQGHLFLEYYKEVPAGCYDVEMAFFNAQGIQSARCTTAVGKNVDVSSGQTREILLFSRCMDTSEGDGVDEGPTVEMIEFDPTAFMGCDGSVRVCATVRNVGEVQMSWAHHDGKPLSEAIRVEEAKKSKKQQRTVQCTQWKPYYHGETTGRLTATPAWAETIDDGHDVLFAERHQVHFPMYVECPDRKKKAGPAPPITWPDDKIKPPKFPGIPKAPKIPKFPKDPKDPGDPKDPKPPKVDDEGLRVIAALNRPPHLESVDYEPGKFVSCPAEVTLCATAKDPDGDPMRFAWDKLEGPPVIGGPTKVKSKQSEGSRTECVRYQFSNKSASYNFEVTVFDMFYDDDRNLVTAESWLSEQAGKLVKSRASMQLPVHVSCQKK